MSLDLPEDKMPEAEVALRLAHYLIASGLATQSVKVGIDGAQVKTGDRIHFPIEEFLLSLDWRKLDYSERWQGTYRNPGYGERLVIHSTPGVGDVAASIQDGRRLLVECKKGPLVRSKSSVEYRLLHEALGQVLTAENIHLGDNGDVLAVAVPKSKKFEDLAGRWRNAPLVRASEILILTVDRKNEVEGLKLLSSVTSQVET